MAMAWVSLSGWQGKHAKPLSGYGMGMMNPYMMGMGMGYPYGMLGGSPYMYSGMVSLFGPRLEVTDLSQYGMPY